MTDVEKACAFFSCGPNGKTTQELLYNIGVLLCANYGQLVELNTPDLQNSAVVEEQPQKPSPPEEITLG